MAWDLTYSLQDFSWGPALTGRVIQCLHAFCDSQSDGDDALAKDTNKKWIDQLILACLTGLREWMTGSPVDEATVINMLFSLGEVCIVGISPGVANTSTKLDVPEAVMTLVQRLVAPVTADGDAFIIPTAVRAHAFVVLGKFCVRDRGVAKKCIGVFVRELSMQSGMSVVRNNVLVVLGDLCRQYTGLVDRYVPNMAMCLMDVDKAIRKNALLMLTELLLERFIKWRGVLLLQFLAVLCDPEPELVQLAKDSLFGLFAKRDASLLPSNFVEALYSFNGVSHAALSADSGGALQPFARFGGHKGKRLRFVA